MSASNYDQMSVAALLESGVNETIPSATGGRLPAYTWYGRGNLAIEDAIRNDLNVDFEDLEPYRQPGFLELFPGLSDPGLHCAKTASGSKMNVTDSY